MARFGPGVGIDKSLIAVAIVMSQPFHAVAESSLVPPPGRNIELVVGGNEHVQTPGVG